MPVGLQPEGPWRSLAVVAEDDVWAVGANAHVAHRTAAGWSVQRMPEARFNLLKIVAWPGGAWAVAAGPEIFRYGSEGWTRWTPPALEGRGVGTAHAVGESDVWVVAPLRKRGAAPELLHWDGTQWALHSPVTRGGALSTMHGCGSEVWAVGYLTRAFGKKPLALRWRGDHWEQVAVPFRGRVSSVYVGERIWLISGRGELWCGDGDGWEQVPVEERVTAVYAPPDGPAWLVTESRHLWNLTL